MPSSSAKAAKREEGAGIKALQRQAGEIKASINRAKKEAKVGGAIARSKKADMESVKVARKRGKSPSLGECRPS